MTERQGKTVACILARMNSRRLPGKVLVPVEGVPMLERMVHRLRTARTVDEIVICTSSLPEDHILLEKADAWGVGGYAGSEENVLSRIMDVAERYSAALVLRVTGDNVLTCPATIDRMVPHHIASGAEYTRTNKLPLGATAEVLSVSMLDRLQSLLPHPNENHLMPFAYDPRHFHCEVLEAHPDVRRPHYGLTLDTPEDLARLGWIHRECPAGKAGPTLERVVALLDKYPEICRIPADAPICWPGGATMTFSALLELMDERAAQARSRNASR
ncbi:MAG: NTP transferase domain-containing protein [Candidatus Hydrogenedentes bacterium]|nr:NTP transferase domain-containing protein [Candidatus Hydrogenedentota bacterium]